ncbi:unnamed protein product [Blepharisma stoltei]|uniref:DNA sliding clamp PCNA n=1 Tax=Blepharisma stoltei TaxID=1481888 RepID=A0AAU9IXU9_9CILI|nr:unnamed protein product [Blepharisma stoltei]
MTIQAMDASHVALVVLSLRSEKFEEYRCDRPQTLGISIGNLSKLVKVAGNDDSISLRADDEARVLILTFRGKNSERTSEFQLNLLTLESEHLGVIDQEYVAEITMPSLEFGRICRELAQITDTITIAADKEIVNFAVSGDIGSGSVAIKPNDSDKPDEKCIIKVSELVSMNFALRYLNLFNKASMLSNEVSISLSPEVPISLQYEFELGELRYYLAPKIAEDA